MLWPAKLKQAALLKQVEMNHHLLARMPRGRNATDDLEIDSAGKD